MTVAVTYRVDTDQYHAPGAKHDISLVTTEYAHRNEVLVYLQIGKNLGIHLNNLMRYEFKGSKALRSEQFLFKKAYSRGKLEPITRSTFDEKQKQFDMHQTTVEQEILEVFAYTDKTGLTTEVQIVITVKAGVMTAIIDFKDMEQHRNFIPPAWLLQLS